MASVSPVLDCSLTAAASGDVSKVKQQHCVISQPTSELKLTVINIETEDELVECQLATAKHSSVSFKFSRATDRPTDVAASLVS